MNQPAWPNCEHPTCILYEDHSGWHINATGHRA